MANRAKFSGTGVAMITPFKNDGSIDFKNLKSLTEQLIKNGVDYLVVLGTTAETPTLSKDEKLEIIDFIRRVNAGRVPMVVGAGGNNTLDVIAWMKEIGTDGIDAYLSVAPYYNKPSQMGMKQHFSAIATSSDLPIILYNVPGRTGSNIDAETTLELAHSFPGKIIAVKEASGNFPQIMKIISARPEGFLVLSGDDAATLPMIAMGADGVISVIGNALPALFTSTVNQALASDFVSARKGHYRLLPYIDAIFEEGNPTGVKSLMEVMGNGECNLRLPLIPATNKLREKFVSMLKENQL